MPARWVICVMRLLSIGPSGITTPNDDLNHTMSFIHTPSPIQFIAYGIGERAIPELGQGIRAVDIRASLNVLAVHLQGEACVNFCGPTLLSMVKWLKSAVPERALLSPSDAG